VCELDPLSHVFASVDGPKAPEFVKRGLRSTAWAIAMSRTAVSVGFRITLADWRNGSEVGRHKIGAAFRCAYGAWRKEHGNRNASRVSVPAEVKAISIDPVGLDRGQRAIPAPLGFRVRTKLIQ
jgi:hypothetical protein